VVPGQRQRFSLALTARDLLNVVIFAAIWPERQG
jgi:hypothetical protein